MAVLYISLAFGWFPPSLNKGSLKCLWPWSWIRWQVSSMHDSVATYVNVWTKKRSAFKVLTVDCSSKSSPPSVKFLRPNGYMQIIYSGSAQTGQAVPSNHALPGHFPHECWSVPGRHSLQLEHLRAPHPATLRRRGILNCHLAHKYEQQSASVPRSNPLVHQHTDSKPKTSGYPPKPPPLTEGTSRREESSARLQETSSRARA